MNAGTHVQSRQFGLWPAATCLGLGWALAVGALILGPWAAHVSWGAAGYFVGCGLAALFVGFGAWLAAVRLASSTRRALTQAAIWALAAVLAFGWFSHAPIDRQTDAITIDWTTHTTAPSPQGVSHITQGGVYSFGSWRALESMALFGAVVGFVSPWMAMDDRLARRVGRSVLGAAVWSLCAVVGGHATVVLAYAGGMFIGAALGGPFARIHVMSVAMLIVITGAAIGAWLAGAVMSWVAWRLAPRTRGV